MLSFEKSIAICLKTVEERFDKGGSEQWSTQDFVQLAEAIHAKTGTLLSVSTLKRLWGKVKHNTKPNRSTLDALAQYIAYGDWVDFMKSLEEKEPRIFPARNVEKRKSKKVLWTVFGLGILLAILVYAFRGRLDAEPARFFGDLSFTSKVISDDIPNSVVFTFNPVNVPEGAKVEIQQSWDARKRTPIDNLDSVATSIYMRPGYFKAKLVVDDSIVAEDDVYIPTDGWLGLIERDPKPIYLKSDEIHVDQNLAITPEILRPYGIDPLKEETWVSFYNVRDFGELYTDGFTMETSVKNTWDQGMGKCQNVRIAILYDGGAIIMPLSAKGCSSNLGIMAFNDQIIDGKKNDLSGFGVDFNEFQNLKCAFKNERLEFYVNGVEVFSMDTAKLHKRIVGIVYHFEGSGAIKELLLSNAKGVVYQEAFTSP